MTALDPDRSSAPEAPPEQLDELPVLPSVVTQVVSMDATLESFCDDIEALARIDPPLAVRIFQLANRAQIASYKVCSSLREAIDRLGPGRASGIMTSTSVQRIFVVRGTGERELWAHSIQVATAAECIARAAPGLGVDVDEAYLAGLLHDIGRFVMLEMTPDEFASVNATGWTTPGELIAADRATTSLDHASLGWRACERWNLPNRIALLARNHHDDETASHAMPPNMEPLVRLVQQADLLSCALMSHPRLVEKPKRVRALVLRGHCFLPHWSDPPVLAEALAEMLDEVDEASRKGTLRLGLAPDPQPVGVPAATADCGATTG